MADRKSVFVCRKCFSIFGGTTKELNYTCKTCSGRLEAIEIPYDQFASYSPEQLSAFRQQIKSPKPWGRPVLRRIFAFIVVFLPISLLITTLRTFFGILLGGIPTLIIYSFGFWLFTYIYRSRTDSAAMRAQQIFKKIFQ